MEDTGLPLAAWANFYVIVGSAAGGLTGLTFVVIALVAGAHAVRLAGLRAFITPTIVHFCVVLVVSALLNVPGQTRTLAGICLSLVGLIGLFYCAGTVRYLNRHRPHYVPVMSDWIWNVVLPTLCFLTLLFAGWLTRAHPAALLYLAGAVCLLLLLIGIHNAWDIAVWFTAERPEAQAEAEKSPPPNAPPGP